MTDINSIIEMIENIRPSGESVGISVYHDGYDTACHDIIEQLRKMSDTKGGFDKIGKNYGHGHVWQRPDGLKARCGGVGMCKECSHDQLMASKFRNSKEL